MKYKFTAEGQAKLAAAGGGAGKDKEGKQGDRLVWVRPGTLDFEADPSVSTFAFLRLPVYCACLMKL